MCSFFYPSIRKKDERLPVTTGDSPRSCDLDPRLGCFELVKGLHYEIVEALHYKIVQALRDEIVQGLHDEIVQGLR